MVATLNEIEKEYLRPGESVRQERVPLGGLQVDHSYQPQLDAKRVGKYADNWDRAKAGVVYISERDDGTRYIIDGQHRVGAMIRVYHLTRASMIDALVYRGLTVQREAELWLGFNRDRKQRSAREHFITAVIAKEPEACGIQQVLDSCGLRVAITASAPGIACVATLRTVYRKGGPEVLEEALRVLGEAYPGNGDAWLNEMVRGTAYLVARYGDYIEHTRLVRCIRTEDPRAIIAKAQMVVAAEIGQRGNQSLLSSAVSKVMLQLWNRGLNVNQRVEWREPPTPGSDKSWNMVRF